MSHTVRWECETTQWNGFVCHEFQFEGHDGFVVLPEEGTERGLLAVKTEYRDAFPEAADIPLLKLGYHLCFIKNDNRWGTDPDLDRKARFVRALQEHYQLQEKCVLIGLSCGGLIAIQFAAKYPELIGCIYLDAPVVNYMSCPCGFGVGKVLGGHPTEILNALGLSNISELLSCREMPLDKLPILVEHKLPVVLVSGDSDRTVPFCENGILVQRAYEAAGLDMEVYLKPGGDHHPHGLADPAPVIDFIERHMK